MGFDIEFAADATTQPTRVTPANPFPVGNRVWDGSAWQPLKGTATGGTIVQGPAAGGATLVGNPVLIAGSDATLAQTLRVESASNPNLRAALYEGSSQAQVRNLAVTAESQSRPKLLVANFNYGYNGSTYDTLLTANAAAGTTGTGLFGSGNLGWDGTNWQKLGVGTDGVLKSRLLRAAFTVTPVLTVGGAYTAGDCFGTKVTVSSASPVSGGVIVIEQVTLVDKSDATGNAFDILFFGTDPASSTFTDNSAPTVDETTDLGNLSGMVRFVAGDFVDVGGAKAGTVSASHATANLPLPVTLAATSLYVVVLAQNTNSYTAGDVIIRLKVSQ